MRLIIKALAAVVATVAAQATISAQEIYIEPIDLMGNAQTIYPTVYDSTLYFSSNKKWELGKTIIDQNENHLFQIYKADLKNSRPTGHVHRYLGGARPYNMFSVSFDTEGRAYIAQNNMQSSVVRGAPVSVYVYDSDEDGVEGTRLTQLPAKASCGMPAVSPDGRMLIFASDMRGGEGRSDLYYCTLTNEGWSTPCNMGSNINTPGVETSPFIHPSGKIFFASNGRDDSQGLDIYYTFRTEDGFAEPRKFDEVINTTRDDYGLFYSKDEKWGYVTSNRSGQDKIYYFRRTFPTFTECDSMQTVDLCYTLYEASAENYDTTTFVCKWSFGDGASATGVEVDHCYAGPGTYVVELSVLDKTTNEELFSLAQYELEIEDIQQVAIEAPAVIRAEVPATFKASADGIENFHPRDFYWDFGNGEQVKGEQATTTFYEPGEYRIECGTIDVRNPNIKRCTWISIVVQ